MIGKKSYKEQKIELTKLYFSLSEDQQKIRMKSSKKFRT